MLLRFKLSPAVRMLLIAAALGLCLTPVHSQNTTATVMSQVGQVSVISDSRDMQALYVGGAVRPQQIIVTGPDGYATFQVSDGSTFEVFQNARVVFRPTMGKWTDLLNVVIGRVKVFITHPNGKLNPNEVSSPTAVISVRGTVFDVIVEDVDGTTLVTLDEGVVTVRNLTAAGNSVQLNPGDFVRVFRNQQLGAVKPDKSNAVQMALRALRDAALQGLRGPGQRAGVGLPGGSVPGAQGDKGKTGTSAPGAPPAAPGGPPPPPGGH